jgi:uncharacterized membrane protein
MAPKPPRRPYLIRLIRARPRTFLAAALMVVLTPLLPAEWRLVTRLLVAWNVSVALYLGLALELMLRSDVGRIRARAANEDEGRVIILALTILAAMASLGAIILELGMAVHNDGTHRPAQLVLTTLTILLSWLLIHIIFAFHYAHEYYDEDDSHAGLKFPGDQDPDYLDFAYFSFVIGMTSQVSDVAIASRSIRRTATAHGILSFFFNTALLALMINTAASIL